MCCFLFFNKSLSPCLTNRIANIGILAHAPQDVKLQSKRLVVCAALCPFWTLHWMDPKSRNETVCLAISDELPRFVFFICEAHVPLGWLGSQVLRWVRLWAQVSHKSWFCALLSAAGSLWFLASMCRCSSKAEARAVMPIFSASQTFPSYSELVIIFYPNSYDPSLTREARALPWLTLRS